MVRPINFRGKHKNSWSINSRVKNCIERHRHKRSFVRGNTMETSLLMKVMAAYATLKHHSYELSKHNHPHQELQLQEELVSVIWPKAQVPGGCQDTD